MFSKVFVPWRNIFIKAGILQYFMAGLPDLEKCVQCGDCGAVCPITPYHTSEAYSPRGRLFFLNMASKTHFPSNVWTQFQKLLFDCTGCGRCQEICDSDVDLISLWEHSRKNALKAGHQSDLQSLVDTLASTKNIFGMDNDDREDLIVSGVEDEIPNIENRVYSKGMKADLVFFVGCLQSFRSAQIPALIAQLKLLEEFSGDYLILGGAEYCCGHPLGVLGLEDAVKPFEEYHRALFDEISAKTIVTNCPGCLISLRNRYSLSQETLHFSEWLTHNVPESDNLELQEEVVFHEPCELSNVLQVKTPPSDVLRRVGVKTTDPEPLCCGGGGMLRITNNKLSQILAEARGGSIEGKQLITSCPSCYEQFRQIGVEVKDLAEIVESRKK